MSNEAVAPAVGVPKESLTTPLSSVAGPGAGLRMRASSSPQKGWVPTSLGPPAGAKLVQAAKPRDATNRASRILPKLRKGWGVPSQSSIFEPHA